MIQEIIEVLYWSVLISATLVGLYVFDYTQYIIQRFLDFKPFNCIYCTSFWVSAIFFVLNDMNIFLAFVTSFMTNEMFKRFIT
jgi:hypothetical protein